MCGVWVSRMRSAGIEAASLPNFAPVAGEFLSAEAAALVVVADRVGGELGLFGHGLLAKILGPTGRAVAIGVGARVVPPGAFIEGGAIKDLVLEVGMLEADADQLHEVLGAEPDRQPALVEWPVAEVADPEAQHAQPVFVGIKRAQGLAERLAQAVARVRPHRDVDADAFDARVEADGVIGGGKDHALDALAARRLEQIAAADDIGVEDGLPGAFDRMPAEVDDAFATFDGPLDLGQIAKLGRDKLLLAAQICRSFQVAQAQLRIDRLEQRAQAPADVAGGSRQQDALHCLAPFTRARLPQLGSPARSASWR